MLSSLGKRFLSSNTVNITLNGLKVAVPASSTILDSCKANNCFVPTLCYHPRLPESGSCRLCLVDVEGCGSPLPACRTKVWEGMNICTETERVADAVRLNLEMIAQNHCFSCASCAVDGECELQDLLRIYGIPQPANTITPLLFGGSSAIACDSTKCVACGRCVQACAALQGLGVWEYGGRAHASLPQTSGHAPLDATACINCGQCATFCPTGALTERDQVAEVMAVIRAKKAAGKTVVIQTAPAVRVTISEAFGMEPGTVTTGQLVAALKKAGFDHVFDVDFAADLTIMEEGTELLSRLGKGGPMMTSCCPGWVNFVEKHYPDFIPNLSSCKSPQGMMGAVVKTYWAEKMGIAPEDIFLVSAMPCTAKKDEAARPQLEGDVDVVLTTRELARLLKLHRPGVNFSTLAPESFSDPHGLGDSTGAAVLFGASGGVMEAALRTVHAVVTGEELPDALLDLEGAVRPNGESLHTATVPVGDANVRVAVVHGLQATREFLERLKAGEEYDFVEVMACPGGCVGGGGNPSSQDGDILARRTAGIYGDDVNMAVRRSHKNEGVKALYDEFLGSPNGHKSHELLHTTYTDRSVKL
ncbi:Iron-only hydrogenase [Carpediemonas membranifera]|uniref:Iron-only hydrogenase n=1 Tax=Carpediemonas membranifera TaxID=201153 RepID=A0A8J6DZ10_9EUKA|nr:Iron-only hydrogenase [Carpediemonas membranifera]|eukprot:KAG9389816.1 Iron-only hydrogenase [Carpediemonas membranifera]